METTRIAVDLAKSVFQVAISGVPGRVDEQHRLSRERCRRFFAARESTEVLMEACGMAHHWGRELEALAVPDPAVRANVEADLELAERLDEIIRSLERTICRRAKVDDPETLELLKTIPGVGRVLALTLLYELHDIDRFPRVGDFLSYARLVKSQKASAGKVTGTSGAKIGNAHLKWAYSEAAVLFLQKNPPGQRLIGRLRSKHGKGKALSILAARLGRASYYMLRRSTAFDMERFLN